VHEQVKRIARVRQVIQPKMTAADALTVPSNPFEIEEGALTSDEAGTERVFELEARFSLTQQQIARVEQGDITIQILAGRAAEEAAFAEDLVLLTGGLNGEDRQRGIVKLRSGEPSVGLLAAAKTTIQVSFRNENESAFGENTYNAIIDAVAKLIAVGENGPYAGIFSFDTFADLNKSLPDRLDTPYDRAKEVLTAGIYSTGAMPKNTGLILSLGGHPFDLFVAKSPRISPPPSILSIKAEIIVFKSADVLPWSFECRKRWSNSNSGMRG
jgi:uncharacterized linocin/CFP29 family protein